MGSEKKAVSDEASKLIVSLKLEDEINREKRIDVHLMVNEKLKKLSDECGVSANKIVNALLEREIMGQA
ncbi:MAG: hypothetical protein LBT59_17560 [Clostridiales bacterium]|nr:hypothetical protein [Clostridiales bacterium]